MMTHCVLGTSLIGWTIYVHVTFIRRPRLTLSWLTRLVWSMVTQLTQRVKRVTMVLRQFLSSVARNRSSTFMLTINKVKAVLVRPVIYKDIDSREIYYPVGTEIIVDQDRLIALKGNEHFFVNQDEFRVLYLN